MVALGSPTLFSALIRRLNILLVPHPPRGVAVSVSLAVLGLALALTARLQLRRFPIAPPSLSPAELRARVGAGSEPWLVIGPLAVDCAAERTDNDRQLVPARWPADPSLTLVIAHPQLLDCRALDGHPVVGQIALLSPRQLRHLTALGLLPPLPRQGESRLLLDTYGGPPAARMLLYFGLGTLAFALAFAAAFLDAHRRWKRGDLILDPP